MTNLPTDKRWITLLWLILSQTASIGLLVFPWIVALTLTALMMAGGVLYVAYVCIFPIIPLILIAIAWILYARRNDKAAATVSGILLLLSIAAFAAFQIFSESLK